MGRAYSLQRLITPSRPNGRSGFSLIQLSGIIVAAGLVAAAVIPEGGGDSQAMRYLTTIKRMEKVGEASVKMMARLGRRPCPASGEYHPGHANFGKEDGTSGDCTDSGATDGILTPFDDANVVCLLYTSPSPRDRQKSRMPSSA